MWYIYIFVNKGIEDGLKGHIRYIIMDGPKGHIRYTSMDISLSQPPTFKSQGGYELKVGDWDTADVGWILGSGKSPGGGNANPLQYSCLKNLMDRGAQQDTAHGVAKSQTWLSMYACQQRALKGWQNNAWYSVNLIMETSPGDSKDRAGSEDATWDFSGGPVVGIHCLQCRDMSSIPGRGTGIPQALQNSQKKSCSSGKLLDKID